jgi:hypothetical protein
LHDLFDQFFCIRIHHNVVGVTVHDHVRVTASSQNTARLNKRRELIELLCLFGKLGQLRIVFTEKVRKGLLKSLGDIGDVFFGVLDEPALDFLDGIRNRPEFAPMMDLILEGERH